MPRIPVVSLITFALSAACLAQGYEVTHFRCDNDVMSVAFKGGTLMVGTRTGLITVTDGTLKKYTSLEGLPSDCIMNVVPIDASTCYIGPIGPFEGPQRLYEASLSDETVSVRDITPDPPLRRLVNIIDVGPDGTLWALDDQGLRSFDGQSWTLHESKLSWPEGSIAFDADGTVWATISGQYFLGHFDGESWAQAPGPFQTSAVGEDADGVVWCASAEGLFKRSEDDWELVSDDEVWSKEMRRTKRIEFDGSGRLWAMAADAIYVLDGTSGELITGIEDFEFPSYNLRGFPLFTSCASMPSDTMVFGLWGYGALIGTYRNLARTRFESCLPGGYVNDIIEDSQGRVWTRGIETTLLGVRDGEEWRQVCGKWLWQDEIMIRYYASGQMAVDLDGAVWVRSTDGTICFGVDQPTEFGPTNSELASGGYVSVADDGTVWFTNPSSEVQASDAAAVEFREETWHRYSSTDYFASELPTDMTVGPDNEVWFRRESGYTLFDGSNWHQFTFGEAELPHPGRLFFDIDGNAYLPTTAFADVPRLSVRRADGLWQDELFTLINDIQCDADGAVWCAAQDAVYVWRGEAWETAPFSEEVCAVEDNILYAEGGAFRICIDHDGNKWMGTPRGVSMIADGGPAQQSVSIEVSGAQPGSELVLELALTNAGRPIAVNAFAAAAVGEQLLYLPALSAEPQPIPLVLPALSTERHELLRTSYDSLPTGSYSIYAALSLLSDTSLLIGPTEDKIAFASIQKD